MTKGSEHRRTDITPPDSQYHGWVAILPVRIRDFALLARFDRPIGTWLLFWPCAWSVALTGGLPREAYLVLLFGIGALVMRGAGCVYNDIVDRDLDRRVERTRSRPLAAGRVSVRAAWLWLLLLCLVGLVVLVQLQPVAQIVAFGSLFLVAAYPFMKRITWWPQAWLGLTFNWGGLVGWAAVTGSLNLAAVLLYAAGLFWTLGYDTIYALQDIEDDALAGIRSTARRLGNNVRLGVGLFYVAAITLLSSAFFLHRADPLVILAVLPAAMHFAWQVLTLQPEDGDGALARFRANRFAGLLVFLGCWVVGSS